MDPIADAAWISDSAILVIAKIYGWAAGLWSIGVTVLVQEERTIWAGRLGTAALCGRGQYPLLGWHAFACRGVQRAWRWPRADDAAELFHGTHQTVCRNE